MTTAEDYKKIIGDIVKKQTDIMGPAVAISIAQKIPAIKVAPNGDVINITGDPKTALEQVAEAYIAFSGEISRMILQSVIKTYPDITINK